MIGPIISVGTRVASLLARALPAASWASLGWLSNDAVDTATGGGAADAETTAVWRLMAGGGFIVGALATIALWKPITALLKRRK